MDFMNEKMTVITGLQRIIALAFPISAGRLLNIISSFIAMMMVAKLGKAHLAAGFLALATMVTVLTLISTIFYAIGIKIRYHQTQMGGFNSIGILVKNGFLLAMILAIPASLTIAFMDKMLLAIGQDPALVSLTKDYFVYAGLGMFPLLATMVIGQFYMGIGKPWFTLIIELINLPLVIIASYGFILGHFGLPRLGLAGASLAPLLTQSLVLVGILVVLYASRSLQAYQLFKKPFVLDWKICQSILSLGLPIGLQFGGEIGAMAAATCLMGYFGVNALAALQITSQYSLIIIMISFGVSQALSLMVSGAYGQQTQNPFLIKQYLHASLLLFALYILPVAGLFYGYSTKLAELYMGTTHIQPDFAHLIHVFFGLAALFLLLDGIRNLLSATLRGLHDSATSTRINLINLWLIALPLAAVTAFYFNGGPIGLRVGFLGGFLLAVILLASCVLKKTVLITQSTPLCVNNA